MRRITFLIVIACALGAKAGEFKLKQEHLNLLHKSIVLWSPVESGAPALMLSPFGVDEDLTPQLLKDVAARAGIKDADKKQIETLLLEMPDALETFVEHAKIEPGTYEYDNPIAELPFAENVVPDDLKSYAHEKHIKFTLTAQHITLLHHARWNGVFMNPKRPYGDMTTFEIDMAEILKVPRDDKAMWKLHTEMMPALQVVLLYGKM